MEGITLKNSVQEYEDLDSITEPTPRETISAVELDCNEVRSPRKGEILPYGFPMPFYVTEHFGGLPIMLRHEDAFPVEGFVWLDGKACPVGVRARSDLVERADKCADGSSNLEWITDMNGEVVLGLALLNQAQHPVLFYLLADGQFCPLAYTTEGVPVEGFVHHHEDPSCLIPIGLQYYENGEPVEDKVQVIDGSIVTGLAVHPELGWSTHHVHIDGVEPPGGYSGSGRREVEEAEDDLDIRRNGGRPLNSPMSQTNRIAGDNGPKILSDSREDTQRDMETEAFVSIERSIKAQLTSPSRQSTSMAAQPQNQSVNRSGTESQAACDQVKKMVATDSFVSTSAEGTTRAPESYDGTRNYNSGDSSFFQATTGSVDTNSLRTPSSGGPVDSSSQQVPARERMFSVSHLPSTGVIKHTKILETRVPTIRTESYEKFVEVKQPTQINTREVEVPFYEDKIIYRPTKQIVEVPVEVVREVKKPILRPVERVVNVPGHIIEVPKPYAVPRHVPKPMWHTKNQLWAVSEKSKDALLRQGIKEVECIRYEPDIRIVDIPIPKRVQGAIWPGDTRKTYTAVSNLSSPHWNTLVYRCNERLANGADGSVGVKGLPFEYNTSGTISIFPSTKNIGFPIGAPYYAEPQAVMNQLSSAQIGSTTGSAGKNSQQRNASADVGSRWSNNVYRELLPPHFKGTDTFPWNTDATLKRNSSLVRNPLIHTQSLEQGQAVARPCYSLPRVGTSTLDFEADKFFVAPEEVQQCREVDDTDENQVAMLSTERKSVELTRRACCTGCWCA